MPLLLLSLLLAAGPSEGPASPPHDSAADTLRLSEVAGGVYVVSGRGGNVAFFTGPDAVLVVDSKMKDLVPAILEKIRSVSDKPVRYLVNTHHHGDHTGGNETFRPASAIVAHDNARRRMLEAPESPAGLPIVTYDSEMSIHLGEETIHLWHTPAAHTDGDTVVYFERANVVHFGDLLFNRIIPFIDVSAGGSAKGYLTALDGVAARLRPTTKVIPGHGEVTDMMSGLRTFRHYMSELVETARRARAAGASREEFLKTVELPDYRRWDGYAERFKDNAAAAFDEMK